VLSYHLTTLGAELLPRARFADVLQTACEPPERFGAWPTEPLPVSNIEAFSGNAALQ
jgi:hypothetical protein